MELQNSLSILPDDLLLLILEFSEEEEIENTRPFQTKWVKKCTMFVDMKTAFTEQNLNNIKWINRRNDGRDLINHTISDYIDAGTYIYVLFIYLFLNF